MLNLAVQIEREVSQAMDTVIENIHSSLGTMILQRWGFPDEISLVPSN